MISQRFIRNESGASAAEFALVLPLMLLFLFGIIDVARYAWSFNQAEKAAQMGVRMAVVTNVIATGLNTETYVATPNCSPTLEPGDIICKEALGTITCGNSGNCQCAAPCPSSLSRNGAAWTNVRDRVKLFAPWIADSSIKVLYSGSGLGYAGNRDSARNPIRSIDPVVTVRLENLQFTPITTLLFTTINLPTVSRSLTMEDGSGSVSN